MTTKPTYRGTTLSCPTCHETYVALGLTDAAEQAAALAGPTCCTPTPHDAAAQGTARREVHRPSLGDVRTALAWAALVGLPLVVAAGFGWALWAGGGR